MDTRCKVITEYEINAFESKVNLFIGNKVIIDIKYSTRLVPETWEGWANDNIYSALIIYKTL